MANWWKQKTVVEGGKEYPERTIDSDTLLGMMAQLHFERQAGIEVTVEQETDEHYRTVAYRVVRKCKNKTVTYRFEKV